MVDSMNNGEIVYAPNGIITAAMIAEIIIFLFMNPSILSCGFKEISN
jgi:hypothetical protein